MTATRTRLREQRGQALVEFALVLIPLSLLLLGILEFGFWFQARSTLRDAVRAAARQQALCRSQTSPTPTQIYNKIVNSSMSNPPGPAITISGDGSCAAGALVTVTGSYNFAVNILGVTVIPAANLTAQAQSIIE
jgi:Flp pilus assembly protein TadG